MSTAVLFIARQFPLISELSKLSRPAFQTRLRTLERDPFVAILELVHNVVNNETLAATLNAAERKFNRDHRAKLQALIHPSKTEQFKRRLLTAAGPLFLRKLLKPVQRYLQL